GACTDPGVGPGRSPPISADADDVRVAERSVSGRVVLDLHMPGLAVGRGPGLDDERLGLRVLEAAGNRLLGGVARNRQVEVLSLVAGRRCTHRELALLEAEETGDALWLRQPNELVGRLPLQ